MKGGLHPALRSLLADPRLTIGRLPPQISLEQYRSAANGFMARAPRPVVASSVDHLLQLEERECRLRLIKPSDDANLPLVLFLHGGGFILGSLESHDALARSIALVSGAAVAALDYRLAPEHPGSAALEDTLAAFRWLQEFGQGLGVNPGRMALAGDSAGGQLAAAAASLLGSQIRHLAMLYPLLDPLQQSSSIKEYGQGYMLSADFIAWAWEAHGGNPEHPSCNVFLSPPDTFPSTSIVIAEFDPLRDEGHRLADNLCQGGVDVECFLATGMIHGFAGLPHLVPEAAAESLTWLGQRLRSSLMS